MSQLLPPPSANPLQRWLGAPAAGALVVLLLWVYYSAQVFLLGAEFTWVFAQRGQPKPVTPAIPQRPG